MSARSHIAQAMVEAAHAINSPHTLQDTLDAIAEVALTSLPGIDHVGVSVVHHGSRLETKSATSALVSHLDALQYELNEGPCVTAMREETVVRVDNAASDLRWPHFIPPAVEAGLRSMLGIQLYAEDETIGVLNLYSTSCDTITAEAYDLAELFAAHSALALGRARREDQLTIALSSRKVIGQAIGMVMERYQVDEERAFGFLTRVSQTSNVKLRTVAQEIVNEGNERSPVLEKV